MTAEELDALCESDGRLSAINPNDAKDDAELAGWICEDLKLTEDEPPPSTRRRVAAESPREAEYEEAAKASDKLSEMRQRRERR